MAVLHIVDSLNAGGRERMAINITNALNDAGIETYLCISRTTGVLEKFILKERIFFMNRKCTFDIKAIYNLICFVKRNDIKVVHAHDSAYFLGLILKFTFGTKLVWHDHFGLSENLSLRPTLPIKIFSVFFDHVIVVNSLLYNWSKNVLRISAVKISLINNFAILSNDSLEVLLPGKNRFSLICVANFRPQKDHITLLKAFHILNRNDIDLYLVGTDFIDDCSRKIKDFIKLNKLTNVYILGPRTDISAILHHCQIGILSSVSEGLPVSILEYGLAGLAVICTDVGQCNKVISTGVDGVLVPSQNEVELANAISIMIDNEQLRSCYQKKYHEKIIRNFSAQSFIKQLIDIYDKLI